MRQTCHDQAKALEEWCREDQIERKPMETISNKWWSNVKHPSTDWVVGIKSGFLLFAIFGSQEPCSLPGKLSMSSHHVFSTTGLAQTKDHKQNGSKITAEHLEREKPDAWVSTDLPLLFVLHQGLMLVMQTPATGLFDVCPRTCFGIFGLRSCEPFIFDASLLSLFTKTRIQSVERGWTWPWHYQHDPYPWHTGIWYRDTMGAACTEWGEESEAMQLIPMSKILRGRCEENVSKCRNSENRKKKEGKEM